MANVIKGYRINIPKVTGNISIICRATSQQVSSNTYAITNKLTNCTNSNKLTSVDKDSPYTGTITENEGYELESVNVNTIKSSSKSREKFFDERNKKYDKTRSAK